MKIFIEVDDDVDIDYPLTVLENALDHIHADYSLESDCEHTEGKFGQLKKEKLK